MSQEDIFDPSGLTALVLDQNHYERRISLDLLRAMGFGRAAGASDLGEAWEFLTKLKPDIVLVEWMDGASDPLDLVRRIRLGEDAPNRAVPMFMLTARGSMADVETARLAGVDGYLRKPISALALQQRVRTVMVKPRQFVVTSNYAGPCRRRRPDPDFAGPWRRLDDTAMPADGGAEAEELDLKAELARARVAALEASARDLTAGDAKAARLVFGAAQDLVKVAEQIGDTHLAFATKEMMRYLQAQGATERLDPDVVRTHVAALHSQLAFLPSGLTSERERVANSLKRMVDKKIRQAAAA